EKDRLRDRDHSEDDICQDDERDAKAIVREVSESSYIDLGQRHLGAPFLLRRRSLLPDCGNFVKRRRYDPNNLFTLARNLWQVSARGIPSGPIMRSQTVTPLMSL